MFRPFYKFFNVNLISMEARVNNQKVYKNLNGRINDSMSEEEKERFIKVLEEPTKKMFKKFGAEIEIKR